VSDADHWRALAQEHRARAAYETELFGHQHCVQVLHNKAAVADACAAALDLQEATGVWHCANHLRPNCKGVDK